MKIIFASNNQNKIKQVKKYIDYAEVVGLKEFGINIDVEENGNTFNENAIIKAEAISKLVGKDTLVIADDSGLCIPHFDNWPGVFTHRFLGENATVEERNNHILEKMKELDGEDRKCNVVCSIAVCYQNKTYTFEGVYSSYIAKEKFGNNNFGFDEIVLAPDKKQTLACLDDKQKLEINARSLALKKASEFIKNL